ncbi:MAG: chloride channel protein [Zoogloeaceae bacterium]|jgi:H+/Cl- antiporter ClcA|nr:chloride channel protein [Zoogloeaceae bacterium]
MRHLLSRLHSALPRHPSAYLKLWMGRLVFWSGAIGVGLLAVLYGKLEVWLTEGLFYVLHEWRWCLLLLSPLGGALCLWLTRRFFHGAEGSGIPQTLAEMRRPQTAEGDSAAEERLWRPLLSLRILFGKLFLGAASIGCGFSLGREGPMVQIGAALMNSVYRFLPKALAIRRDYLIVAGGAAGIAAAFNAPLAGILFAIEELSRGVQAKLTGVIITAIVLAGIVAQGFMGRGNFFGNVLILGSQGEQLKAVVVASVVCGVTGGLFSWLLLHAGTNWKGHVADFRREHPIGFAAICGLILAAMGLATGGASFGSGLEEARLLLERQGDIPWYFAPVKYLATLIASVSGVPGGILSPALAIGAGVGHNLAPLLGQTATPGMLLALCMAGFLAATMQAPLTSFVIVMEMTDSYSIVIPLMAVSLFSSVISRLFSPPMYATLAENILLRTGPLPEEATRAAKVAGEGQSGFQKIAKTLKTLLSRRFSLPFERPPTTRTDPQNAPEVSAPSKATADTPPTSSTPPAADPGEKSA